MIWHYTDVIAQANEQIQLVLNHFIESTYSFIAHTFKSTFVLCFLIYIILIGYGVIQGWFQLVWRDFILLLMKFALVAALLFSWHFFQDMLVDFFTHGVESISDKLSAHVFYQGTKLQGESGSIGQGLLLEVAHVGLWVFKMAGFTSFMPIIFALLLWICGLGVILYGVIQLLIAKIMIAFLLGVAPFVIIFFLFSSFEQTCWNWISLLFSYFFTLIFVSIALNLSFYLLHTLFDRLYETKAAGVKALQLIPIVLLSVLSFVMIRRCVQAAHRVGSGILPSMRRASGLPLSIKHLMKGIKWKN